MTSSCALTTDTHEQLVAHLDRPDRQEDLCFALYYNSRGHTRETAIVTDPIPPREGEREIHGNASFTAEYLLRAADLATDIDAGLVFLHSHPHGRDWQDMSQDDIAAERGYAAQVLQLTGRPLVGMTLATGDGAWAARSWTRAGDHDYRRVDCETVRVVGDELRVTYHPLKRPPPAATDEQIRTVSAWGAEAQAELARLKIAIVGGGSVGALVAEALARIGVEQLLLIDFDTVKLHNRDRLLHTTARDARLARSKVDCLRRGLLRSTTAAAPTIEALDHSVVEADGFAAALDCDLIFSCVDRPWARSALNLAAYAHLIPVVDGGILVTVADDGRMLGADWKAHVAAPGRRCLECLKQYDPGLVAVERDGLLDDPKYINGLPRNHPLRARENVFPFSMSTAAFQVLQAISTIVAPQRIADLGAQTYHAVTGELDIDSHTCRPNCPYANQLTATGDSSGLSVTDRHFAAEQERAARKERHVSWRWRLDDWLDRYTERWLDAISRRLAPRTSARPMRRTHEQVDP